MASPSSSRSRSSTRKRRKSDQLLADGKGGRPDFRGAFFCAFLATQSPGNRSLTTVIEEYRAAGCSWARTAVRAGDSTLASLVEKARGCDIDFLRCSFRLFPFKPHVGEMPSPKIGSLTGFFERSIRPEPPSAPTRIQNELQLKIDCSGGEENGDSRLMERCRKRGKSPCFERFVSERRQT